MNQIKTYKTVSRENETIHFKIMKMENMYDERNGEPDDPHRHNFYTVILVNNAKGKHFVDFVEYPLGNKHVFFIHPGQVHQVIEFDKPSGYVLLFSEEFLITNHIDPSLIGDVNLLHNYNHFPPLPVSEEKYRNLAEFCERILEHNENHSHLSQIFASYLNLFLIECNQICPNQIANLQQIESGHSLLKRMRNLLEEHYFEWHSAQKYADILNISPDHLNRTIKTLTGSTVKEYIQARICTAAKRLLYFSELSNKEIGYKLGFSEPANFSAFFKKCTGTSPSDFRNSKTVKNATV